MSARPLPVPSIAEVPRSVDLIAPAVVVVGAAARDRDTTDPRGWRLGGGVVYGALTLARLGLPARGLGVAALVGVDAEAASAWEIDVLRDSGIAVTTVHLDQGPTFDNIESGSAGRRIQIAGSPSDPIGPGGLPSSWRTARAWLLAPVAGELPGEWAAQPPGDAIVALAWQGLLRTIEPGRAVRRRQPGASPLLGRADVVGVSADDLEPDVRIGSLRQLVRPAATIVLTRGRRGGLVLDGPPDRPTLRRWSALPPRHVVDPTGAGDVFLATLVAARVAAAGAGRAGQLGRGELRLAAAVASLIVEGVGLSGVPSLTDVRRRLASSDLQAKPAGG